MIRALAIVTVLAVVLAACSGPAPGVAGSPGPQVTPAGGPPRIVGVVSAGPVCPVEVSPPDPACAPRPVAGAVIVATADGEEVGRATTEADGRYSLSVGRTGTITVTAQPVDGLMGVPAPVTVRLDAPGEVERLDLSYDTGIR